ncbi:MAG TPA: hypothetical protein V6C81_29040 [Planktothrix sp.]|jgi:hypothetical protein
MLLLLCVLLGGIIGTRFGGERKGAIIGGVVGIIIYWVLWLTLFQYVSKAIGL